MSDDYFTEKELVKEQYKKLKYLESRLKDAEDALRFYMTEVECIYDDDPDRRAKKYFQKYGEEQ